MSPALRASLTVLLLILTVAGCGRGDAPEPAAVPETSATPAEAEAADPGPEPGVDYQSFANVDDYLSRHISLDLSADFAKRILSGTAMIEFEPAADGNAPLILDTRDLTIDSVNARVGGAWEKTTFTLRPPVEILGAALEIALPAGADAVRIAYQTSPEASGLQWLTPRQTAGGRHPFLFTQAQPTHARSFVPLQDTPAVRITYDATIRTPVELRALMSANNDPNAAMDGVFEFSMPQPIPSYLLALAIGDVQFKPIGARTGVYAEAEILDAAAAEFEDTEAMLVRSEQAYGPYQWDRYDLLILPPSFPFGGMENPRLSFITPTVIAGDKSLVALIAHELAHSWSGNLVTNASWRDLWLNEGFTTYLTYRIMEDIFGEARYRMEMALGRADLDEALADLEPRDEVLALDIRDRDPDEAFSNIPYEKGALFLYELEQTVGREDFDAFLLDYFNAFEFESLSTEDFLAYLDDTLLETHADVLERDRILEWIYEPGLPDGAPNPTSDAFTRIDPIRQQWLEGELAAADIETADWTYHQWRYFLDGMPESLSDAQLDELDAAFALTTSANNEIVFSWLMIAIRNDYAAANARIEAFLTSIGRNKFLRPLYQALVDAGRGDEARRIFELAEPGYHPLTVRRNAAIVYPDSDG